jgi:hypothetical protein
VTKSNSVTNDIPDPANPDAPKFPSSELIFQLLQEQAGDDVSDTCFIIRHAITQKGTLAVLTDAMNRRASRQRTWAPGLLLIATSIGGSLALGMDVRVYLC